MKKEDKMKTKKILALLLGMLLLGAIFCNNKVKATEVTDEYLNNMLDVLPNEIEIDIPELEFKNASRISAI